jgi:hypothetical protein
MFGEEEEEEGYRMGLGLVDGQLLQIKVMKYNILY